MTTVLANKLIAGALLIAWAIWRMHWRRLHEKEELQELEAIRQRYKQSPLATGFFDSMLALFGSSIGPRAIHIFYGPFFSWVLLVLGCVAILDVLVFLATGS